MKLFAAVSIFLIFNLFASGQTRRNDRVTQTPQRDVLARAEYPDQGLVQFDCEKCSAMTDLLFIAARESCGNAGCTYFVFKKKQVGSFEYLTTAFMNPGFVFLKTKHHGMNDMLSCFHINAGECALVRSEFDGKFYRDRARVDIDNSQVDSRMPDRENVTPIYLNKDLQPSAP
jgi:hypothetical protein